MDAKGMCVAIDTSCPSGQIKQADGTCKSPDGTISCPIGQNKNASGQCVAITCPFGQMLNASGQCVAIICTPTQVLNVKGVCEDICPSGQLRNAAGSCAAISTFQTSCGGKTGLTGPSFMMFKYLDKTNPNPTSVIGANADSGIYSSKGLWRNRAYLAFFSKHF